MALVFSELFDPYSHGVPKITLRMPPEMALLTSLQAIYLGARNNIDPMLKASLRDLVPTQLLQLENLTDLQFGSVDRSISSYLGNMSQLEGLFLYSGSLTGRIPSELGQCTRLTSPSIKVNSLTGQVPSELMLLTNLEMLDLSGNTKLATSIPSEFGLWTNLESFDCWDTMVTSSLSTEFGLLKTCALSQLPNPC
jgi:Leucine-rich repeat (LRR) protein